MARPRSEVTKVRKGVTRARRSGRKTTPHGAHRGQSPAASAWTEGVRPSRRSARRGQRSERRPHRARGGDQGGGHLVVMVEHPEAGAGHRRPALFGEPGKASSAWSAASSVSGSSSVVPGARPGRADGPALRSARRVASGAAARTTASLATSTRTSSVPSPGRSGRATRPRSTAPSLAAAMPPPEPMLGSTRIRRPVSTAASRARAIARGTPVPLPAMRSSGRGASTVAPVEAGGGGGSPAHAENRAGGERRVATGRSLPPGVLAKRRKAS
jgi:hypothetical protein